MAAVHYISEFEGTSTHDGPPPGPALGAVRRDVSKGLKLPSSQGRAVSEGNHALLVDFDGVDLNGKDRHSACLNPGRGLVWVGCR